MNFRRKVESGLRLLRSRFTENSAILLFHRVAEKLRDPFNLCVSPEHFAEQMEALRRVGAPLGVADFVRLHREGNLPKGSICVTFDDGFVDVLENAVPILETYEIPATVYCISGCLGQPLWWDRLIDKIYSPSTLPERIELESGGGRISVAAGSTNRGSVIKRLYPFFLQLAPGERDEQVSVLGKLTGQTVEPSLPRLMTAEELKTLSSHPLITIGAHTVTHSRLADLSHPAQLAEIKTSIDQLAEIVEVPVTTFSYPFGLASRDYTAETMAAAREAGTDHAMAADLGVVTSSADPFCLPRLWIHDAGEAAFARKLRRWL